MRRIAVPLLLLLGTIGVFASSPVEGGADVAATTSTTPCPTFDASDPQLPSTCPTTTTPYCPTWTTTHSTLEPRPMTTCPNTTTYSPTCTTTTVTHQATLENAPMYTCQHSTTTVNLPATYGTTPTPTPVTEATGTEGSGTVALPTISGVVGFVVLAVVGLVLAARNRT